MEKNRQRYTGEELNVTDKYGNTALYYAVSGNHYDSVEMLIRLGANVNCKNEFGNTPLHKAIMLGQSQDIINLLINFRGDLKAVNNFRQTPLFFASKRLAQDLGLAKLTASIVTYEDIEQNKFKMNPGLMEQIRDLKTQVQLRKVPPQKSTTNIFKKVKLIRAKKQLVQSSKTTVNTTAQNSNQTSPTLTRASSRRNAILGRDRSLPDLQQRGVDIQKALEKQESRISEYMDKMVKRRQTTGIQEKRRGSYGLLYQTIKTYDIDYNKQE